MNVVGHRGASAAAPENTMASFLEAHRLGADAIEFDVHATADGELVVIHDFMVDRTTDGHGEVFEMSYADVRALDAGSWFSPDFAGERVPRLDEVLALDGLWFELEIKGYGRTLLDRVLATVDAHGVLDRVEFTGFNLPLLTLLKAEVPEAVVGLFSFPRAAWMTDAVYEHTVVGMAETAGFDVAHVYARTVTERIVDRLHALGMQVHANDAANAGEIERVLELGVDRLSANDVATAVAIVDASGARST